MVVPRRWPLWVPLALPSLLFALITVPAAGLAGSLEGTATLKVMLPVPEDALFEAQLQEIGAADTTAVLLGKARLKPAGLAPFRFRIPYVDGMLRPGHFYSVRAVISAAGRLLFTTDKVQPVFREGGTPLQLQLVPVGDAPLRGVTWLQAPAASQPVSPQAARQEVKLRLDPLTPMVTGSADCNRLQGTYRLQGDQLSFSTMDSTMLQCEPEVMADERRFLADLQRVRGWRFVDRTFELLDASGAVLLKLETRPLPSPPAATSGG
ncbi:MAG: META domain-containing protein [Cyanobium sp.]